jgi:tryptophan synthase alpha chain
VSAGLAPALAGVREAGAKAFVPYVTAGCRGVDAALLRALRDAGADAAEIGIPFSDPVMDGPVIQEASRRALTAGTTPQDAMALVADSAVDIPVVVMTYLNPVLARGETTFLTEAVASGVAGAIVPDLPVDEAGGWIEGCRSTGVAPVFLAAPNSSPERLAQVAEASEGFVYCVSTLGVTGSRHELAGSARGVVEAIRPLTQKPLLVGVGISTPEQAAAACEFADGVVVGSALVRCLLEGDRDGMLRLADKFRSAIRP